MNSRLFSSSDQNPDFDDLLDECHPLETYVYKDHIDEEDLPHVDVIFKGDVDTYWITQPKSKSESMDRSAFIEYWEGLFALSKHVHLFTLNGQSIQRDELFKTMGLVDLL